MTFSLSTVYENEQILTECTFEIQFKCARSASGPTSVP